MGPVAQVAPATRRPLAYLIKSGPLTHKLPVQPAAQPTGGKPFFAAARRQPPRQRPRTDSEDHGLQDERAGRRDRTPAYLVLRDRAVERRRQRINILKNVWAKVCSMLSAISRT